MMSREEQSTWDKDEPKEKVGDKPVLNPRSQGGKHEGKEHFKKESMANIQECS